MLRTCNICGGIHQEDKMCKRKYPNKKNSKANSFRNTNAWITKREQIKRRDKCLCQVCLMNNIYTYNNQAERGLITKEQLLEIIDPPGEKKKKNNIFFYTHSPPIFTQL